MNALKFFSLQAVLICLLLLTGCSKNEQPVAEAVFTVLSIKLMTVDQSFLTIRSNEVILSGQATAPSTDRYTFSVQYFDPRHRINLIDNFSRQVVADTIITYKPGYVNAVTFYQPAAGAPVRWLGPPVNEPAPAAGSGKISVIYTYDLLPDLVKVVVENKVGNSYVVTDNFQLAKGAFSRYFECKSTGNEVQLKFYTTSLPEKLVATTSIGAFTDMNTDFSIYQFAGSSSCGTCIKNLSKEKLY
ncbi:hypothetical protein [Paraflavitalea speifideaquila]|uniref:hypothetical protein n=1 Tax=Paraflavitalea speifideaquila TaxID=3076558 RepID=UPI0028EB6BFA|nr:hypothetical protein [Paraflavitalea speifideiaquila]